jgi:hypothetical protein
MGMLAYNPFQSLSWSRVMVRQTHLWIWCTVELDTIHNWRLWCSHKSTQIQTTKSNQAIKPFWQRNFFSSSSNHQFRRTPSTVNNTHGKLMAWWWHLLSWEAVHKCLVMQEPCQALYGRVTLSLEILLLSCLLGFGLMDHRHGPWSIYPHLCTLQSVWQWWSSWSGQNTRWDLLAYLHCWVKKPKTDSLFCPLVFFPFCGSARPSVIADSTVRETGWFITQHTARRRASSLAIELAGSIWLSNFFKKSLSET